jgi:hypothetical protein
VKTLVGRLSAVFKIRHPLQYTKWRIKRAIDGAIRARVPLLVTALLVAAFFLQDSQMQYANLKNNYKAVQAEVLRYQALVTRDAFDAVTAQSDLAKAQADLKYAESIADQAESRLLCYDLNLHPLNAEDEWLQVRPYLSCVTNPRPGRNWANYLP